MARMSKNITDLPEDCLSHVLSLTSPKDVVRSSAVSKQFLSASKSDTIWTKFTPSDCDRVITQPLPAHYGLKMDLFLYLARSPLLFDNATKSFGLDWSGKKCYMLGARALSITWGDTPAYWSWKSIPESRFPECAELKEVCWLDINGKMDTMFLSPATTYGAYFVFRMKAGTNSGFENTPVKVSIKEVGVDGLATSAVGSTVTKSCYMKPRQGVNRALLPVTKGDGWSEIEMGRYNVGVDGANGSVVLEMRLCEIERLNWKGGLIVEGIEVRPIT